MSDQDSMDDELVDAVNSNDVGRVKELLDRGASKDARNDFGSTVLMIASISGYVEIADILVRRGAELEHTDSGGWTALTFAAWKGHRTVVDMLIKSKAVVRHIDKVGRTAFSVAMKCTQWEAAGLLALAMSCFDDLPVDEYLRLVTWACQSQRSDIARNVCKQAASTQWQTKDGDSVLMLASARGDDSMVERMITYGANVDHRNKTGETALDFALSYDHMSTAGLLVLESHALKQLSIERRSSVLRWASKNGRVDVARKVVEEGDGAAEIVVLNAIIQRDVEETTSLLLASSSLVNACLKNENGWTPLHYAANNGHDGTVGLLLEHKANPDIAAKNGQTPLHIAAGNGHDGIVGILLKHKANPDVADKNSRTPLYIATRNGHDGTVGILLEHKANPDIAAKNGWTPLHHAARNGHDGIVGILLEHKANPDIADENGWTPLHHAARNTHDGTVGILLEHKANPDIAAKDGKKPFAIASGRLKTQLKKAMKEMKFAVLYATGTVKPTVMKLCVIGAAGSGKTTFVDSIQRRFLKYLFTKENQRDDPACEFERTVGINVITVEISGVGRLCVWDIAGSEQFHKSLGIFFSGSNSFFILLMSLVTGEERQQRTLKELMAEAQYYLSFLRASLDGKFIPTVMMAASHGESCSNGQLLLQQVVGNMRGLFHGMINITEESFLLDCRKSRSPEMKQLKRFLKQERKKFVESDVRYPRLCEPVANKLLPTLRRQQEDPFMETEELVQIIEREECPGQDKQVIEKVVDFLDDAGEVVKVDNIISINPCWLSQYAIGPVMASYGMRWHAEAPDGRMTRDEAERAIKQYLHDHKLRIRLKVDTVLKILENLGFCMKLEDGSYMFPAHLPPLKYLCEMWKKEEDKKVYVGRRHFCSSPFIFSLSAFGFFQCQACVEIDKLARMWRNVIIVARAESVSSYVECLVTMDKHLGAVDFVARGREGSESQCLSLLNDVIRVWEDIVDKHSPGTPCQIGYLSRKHITEHKEQIAFYSESDVYDSKKRGPSALVRVVTGGEEVVESLQDLLVLLPVQPESSKVVQAVLNCGQDKWYELGVAMGFADHEIESITFGKPNMFGKLLPLIREIINRDGQEKAEETLLKACRTMPNPIYGGVQDELEQL